MSGSGKTSWAQQQMDNSKLLLSRDKTRKLLFDIEEGNLEYFQRTDLKECELLVSETLDDIIYNGLQKGIDIILDNVHLEKKYIEDILFRWNHLSPIEIKLFPIKLEEAKEKVMSRNNWTDIEKCDYMDRHYSQFQNIKRELHGDRSFYPQSAPQVIFDKSKPPAFVFDIDGTLARKGDHDIYDDENLDLDTVIQEVSEILEALYTVGNRIIFVTGRGEESRKATEQWLVGNGLWYPQSEMYMRPLNDQCSDAHIKEKIVLQDLIPNYNVKAVFDDRIDVSRNFHKLGIFVLNVNQNFI